MILTLTWKELREHQSIWLMMVFMTVVLGLGLAKIVSLNDPAMAVPMAALTVFGMTAAYGVVCGSMMLAGEREGGTLVYLDIFLGRRGLLWAGKAAIGTALVLAQTLAVAAALILMQQELPGWALALVGYEGPNPPGLGPRLGPSAWFLILPVVALEAYAWGLLGSAMTQRVLAGAAVAAVGFTPVWLLAILAPSPCFVVVRLVLALGLLAISRGQFLTLEEEAPQIDKPPDPKQQFLDGWDRLAETDQHTEAWSGDDDGIPWPTYPSVATGNAVAETAPNEDAYEPEPAQADSPSEVLWWLTLQQARTLCCTLAAACLVLGLFIPANGQILWPLATLLLGVACGTAAFAPEQRDLSYQFLSSQHFPLQSIWRFKILFYLAVAILAALFLALGSFLSTTAILINRRLQQPPFWFTGTFADIMGPTLFFGIWLLYGFAASQLVVMLCRKNILALLVSTVAAATALGMWLPSLLCGGMNGWQLFAPPLIVLLATSLLMRAWTSGRIKERKPLSALLGVGAAIVFWALLNFGYRVWECPDVGQPMDSAAFRASLPADKDNAAAKAIHQAIAQFGDADKAWLASMAEASRLPVGVLEIPNADGQAPSLKHLITCKEMSKKLLGQAHAKEPGPAFEHLAQVLSLSRNLRNKAPVASYLAGVQIETAALNDLDHWLTRGKPGSAQLRRVLDELHRHANETPPPLDCLRTECYCSSGLLRNPNTWTLAAPGAGNRIPERWIAGSIALSLETPWEDERRTRIWQLVWAGLFRAVDTPHWELPEVRARPRGGKKSTQEILKRWLPAATGPSDADVFHLLDTSWLADDRLFCSVAPLRDGATRARWRVDSMRLAVALSLYRLEAGKAAPALHDLVPKYLPTGLPIDPYAGQSYGYRIAPNNGQGIVWSTGPDRVDHGGQKHGGHLLDDDALWMGSTFDLIKREPQWP